MIGLTIGLVIEGQTGKNILEQVKYFPSSIHKHTQINLSSLQSAWRLKLAIEHRPRPVWLMGSFFPFQLAGYWSAIVHFFVH